MSEIAEWKEYWRRIEQAHDLAYVMRNSECPAYAKEWQTLQDAFTIFDNLMWEDE